MIRRLFGMALLAAAMTVPGARASTPAERAATAAVEQEGRGGRRGGAAVSVAEAERLFDRYMLGQARVVLQLTADQLAPFAERFDHLQALQRMRQRQRQRRLGELTALSRSGGAGTDDEAMARVLEALDADMVEADRQVREARVSLDEVLSVPQRARYRTFEVRMEREKLQLIARARAAARGRAAQAATGEPADAGAGQAPAPR
jgi:hypothetical protein